MLPKHFESSCHIRRRDAITHGETSTRTSDVITLGKCQNFRKDNNPFEQRNKQTIERMNIYIFLPKDRIPVANRYM